MHSHQNSIFSQSTQNLAENSASLGNQIIKVKSFDKIRPQRPASKKCKKAVIQHESIKVSSMRGSNQNGSPMP